MARNEMGHLREPIHHYKNGIPMMSSNFCPNLIFKFGDLIELSVLKD